MGREVGVSTSDTGRVMRRSLVGPPPPPREPSGGRIRVLDSLLGQVAIAQVGKVLNKGVVDLRNVDRILKEKITKLRERKAELMLELEKDEDPRDRIEEILADHTNHNHSLEEEGNDMDIACLQPSITITSEDGTTNDMLEDEEMGNQEGCQDHES